MQIEILPLSSRGERAETVTRKQKEEGILKQNNSRVSILRFWLSTPSPQEITESHLLTFTEMKHISIWLNVIYEQVI